MRLRTSVGVVELEVWYGYEPKRHRYGCPIRERWGLSAHQQSSPTLEDKLAFTLTATGSYEAAATLAAKWGCLADDSTLHALAQRLGVRAEEQTQRRLKTQPAEREPKRAATALGVLMIDGWQVRQRGAGWGQRRTAEPRVEWHELKTGVFYRHEQAAGRDKGRGQLTDKVVVHWQGEPLELGRRLHWEALREGLGRAQQTLAVGDGAPWIWNLVADRWKGASEVLDFYHASQHLWQLAEALHPQEETQRQAWAQRALHRLRHGQERALLRAIGRLKAPRGERGAVVRREQNYLAQHAPRMHYAAVAGRDWPIGSGAVESACARKQCRFKRPGQFWSEKGLRHLSALEEARHNNHWDDLWLTT